MATYSTNLALTLMATGEQSNTWGDTTNTNLGTLLEQAISGYVTQAITDGSSANTTITIPNGASGVARNMFIEMTGALTFATTSLVVPANKKIYFVYNNTTGGFPVQVKVSGLTGVAVPNGKKMIVVSNGTDIVSAQDYTTALAVGGLTSGRVTYAGTAGLLQDSANLTFSGSALALAGSLTATGGIDKLTTSTGVVSVAAATAPSVGYVLTATSATVATWQAPTSTPAGSNTQVQFNNSGAFGASSALTWDGTTLAATKFSGALNGTVGATTASTGAFTTLSTTGATTLSAALTYGGITLTNAVTGTGKMVLDTTPTIATPVLTNPTVTAYLETAPAIVNSSTTQTISLASGTVLSYTLTGNCVFTMPAATSGTSFIVRLIQDGTGGRTATFTPITGTVKWPGGTAPTITTTASTGVDVISFVCIASVWYGTAAQAFA